MPVEETPWLSGVPRGSLRDVVWFARAAAGQTEMSPNPVAPQPSCWRNVLRVDFNMLFDV